MATNESDEIFISDVEELSVNDRPPLLSEKTQTKIERAFVLSAAVLAFVTWPAQPLDEEPTPAEIIKRELGVTDLTEVDEVRQITDLMSCPHGEGTAKQPDNLESIRSFLNPEANQSFDFGKYALIDGSTAFSYRDGGMDEAVYCGQAVDAEIYPGNAPDGTVLIIPGMHAGTWTGKFFCTSWDDRC